MVLGNPHNLSADKPMVDPKDDRLGYSPFAKHLAESIYKMSPPEGLVVAIYGPWGSGKTTLLNFVVHYLQQKPRNEQPIIVYFNPWWFSGHEDLTRRFFDQLIATLRSRLKSAGQNLIKSIAKFSEFVSEIPLPSEFVATMPYAATAPVAAKVAAKALAPKHKDVPELKAKIAETLKKRKERILVIIDDIDRLTAEEIRQLFRVIKAVADFPNIVYLLAFDKEVAIKALAETQGISGEDYLEKIVQVPFELPLPDKTLLRQLLFEKLDMILTDSPEELFDQIYWGNVYFEGIDHFINTPRDIIRLTNTLSVTYPSVKGEVNSVDFIAVETLRVFCPMVYDIIRKNSDMFAGYTDINSLHGPRVEDLKAFHDSWIKQVQEEDRESVRQFLTRIFPKVTGGVVSYGPSFESAWRKQLRVCSPNIFPIYFRLAIPEGSISNAEIKTMLALASNAKTFSERLIELSNQKRRDGTTRVRAFLERLEDYTGKEVPLGCIPSIVQALFDVGDQLLNPEDERRGMFEFGNDIRIGRIIWQLLGRLEEQERFEVLKKAMLGGQAISTIVREVTVLGQQHGKYGEKRPDPEGERIVCTQHLKELEELALEKVRDAAQRNYLLKAPDLPTILRRWRDWAGEEGAKEWVREAIKDDEGLSYLLEKFLQESFSQSSSDSVGRKHYRLDPKWLEPFLDPSQILDRIKRLSQNSSLTERQKIAINQFIREYEMREEGKNLDSRFTFFEDE
jgi:predicted KAP-like P-loop ATPase